MCSFCVRLCGWTRSLCLSALPSTWRAIRTVTGVARSALPISGWRFCDALSDRVRVFTLVVSLLSVSVFQVLRLFLAWSCSVFPWRVRTGLCSLPELETLHCRVTAPALPMIFAPPLCFGVCTCTASSSHLHCVLELSIKTICFSLAIGSRAFCTVTERSDQDGSSECVRIKRLFISQ